MMYHTTYHQQVILKILLFVSNHLDIHRERMIQNDQGWNCLMLSEKWKWNKFIIKKGLHLIKIGNICYFNSWQIRKPFLISSYLKGVKISSLGFLILYSTLTYTKNLN